LGSQDLDRRIFVVTAAGRGSEQDAAGYIGLDALGAKNISFDFERNELRWRK
jgi:hypothetical protein